MEIRERVPACVCLRDSLTLSILRVQSRGLLGVRLCCRERKRRRRRRKTPPSFLPPLLLVTSSPLSQEPRCLRVVSGVVRSHSAHGAGGCEAVQPQGGFLLNQGTEQYTVTLSVFCSVYEACIKSKLSPEAKSICASICPPTVK